MKTPFVNLKHIDASIIDQKYNFIVYKEKNKNEKKNTISKTKIADITKDNLKSSYFSYIDEAKNLSESRPIDYFIDDINSMKKIQESKYDAIFNFAVLHHATEVEHALQKLAKALKNNGLMFNEEYVGPARNQYSDQHLNLMLEIMSDLPEKFRSKVGFLRPPLANFRVEPSEAIHSDLILPLIPKYFDTIIPVEKINYYPNKKNSKFIVIDKKKYD